VLKILQFIFSDPDPGSEIFLTLDGKIRIRNTGLNGTTSVLRYVVDCFLRSRIVLGSVHGVHFFIHADV
jgi:hypothetical protein